MRALRRRYGRSFGATVRRRLAGAHPDELREKLRYYDSTFPSDPMYPSHQEAAREIRAMLANVQYGHAMSGAARTRLVRRGMGGGAIVGASIGFAASPAGAAIGAAIGGFAGGEVAEFLAERKKS